MPYELLMTGRVEKEFRKFPSHIRDALVNETFKLADNPTLGGQLKGSFRAFRSLHLKIQNIQYRVVYEVIEEKREIYILAVGTRENFYTRLERMKLKSRAA